MARLALGTTSTYVPWHNLIGSTLALVNSSGQLAMQYSYEPFGKATMTGQSSTFPYLFAGMEYDSSTGLYHTPARYYSPSLQRFLSEDPLGFAGGDVNFFAYAGNDPINNSDPSGLQCFAGAVAAATAVAGVAPVATAAEQAGQASVFLIDNQMRVKLPRIGAQASLGGGGNTGIIGPGIQRGQIVLTQEEEGGGGSSRGGGSDIPPERGGPEPMTLEQADEQKIAEHTSDFIVREFLKGASQTKAGRSIQFRKSGGFDAANQEFDRITAENGLGVSNRGNGVRSTVLPNGTRISVRPMSTEGSPTIQINVPGEAPIKVRY